MFIVIDGPDGTGKTTAAKGLVSLCNAKGYDAIFTTEPTDTPLGKIIRRKLRDGGASAAEMTELFVKDRKEHIQNFIQPAQKQGKMVVCDRYRYSTVCYQNMQGEPLERLLSLNADFPAPDITFLLSVGSVDVLLNRITSRGQERDIFEARPILEKCLNLYQRMPEFYPQDEFYFITAEKTETEILHEMFRLTEEKIHRL